MSPAPSNEPSLTKAKLARTWTKAVSRTTNLPMSGAQAEQLLAGLIDRLVTATAGAPIDERAAVEVATELVTHGLTGSNSIGGSIEVLYDGLPRLPDLRDVDRPDGAVLKVLASLASGYAEALRQRTIDEQQRLAQALRQDKQETELELRICEGRFRAIFSTSAVGIAISTFDGTVVATNPAFAEIVGRAQADLIGAALPDLLQAQDDITLIEAYRRLTSGALTRFRHRRQFTATTGEIAWTHLGGSLLCDADGTPTHHLTVVENVTELQLLRQELSTQALHDIITGLPNEQYLMSHLQEVLEKADPSALVTLLRVNLDNFSVINDGIGRAAGEVLLRSVARRLADLVAGQPAMVARIGADDFAILIEDGPDSPDPHVLATNINEALREPLYLDGRGLAVSAGVGVVHRHAEGISPTELLRAADATLHRAKRIGQGQWDFYDAHADARERERYQLAAEMPGAWESGEIEMWFQPVYGLDSGLIVAIQTLLRWARADGTVLGNPACLALAEKSGLVGSLGPWMVREACLNLATWTACLGPRSPLLRVDLTVRLSQDPDLVAVVNSALDSTGARIELLQVGVPLAALARGHGDVEDNADMVAQLGAGVVLVGAGAGMGYMAYLEDFQVGAVQLAPDVVSRIARRPGDDSVVARALRAAIPLVHSTGATVIVPEVDAPEQAQWWRSAGADCAAGAHFGPIIPGSGLQPLLAAEPPGGPT